MICPLCSAPVSYQGLVDIECEGRGCPNYKPPPKKPCDFPFGEERVSWEWFQRFAAWFSTQTGEGWAPVDGGMSFELIRVAYMLNPNATASNPDALICLRFFRNSSQKDIQTAMSQPVFPHGVLNPYHEFFQ